jgi:hypothetical protein
MTKNIQGWRAAPGVGWIVLAALAGAACSRDRDDDGGAAADPAMAAQFCAAYGACQPDQCGSPVCCDGRDCTPQCIAVATRFRADVVPSLRACLTCSGDSEPCVFAVEERSDDRTVDREFAQACVAAFACNPDPVPEGFPELCQYTGLFTADALEAAMPCFQEPCNTRARCIADALGCSTQSVTEFCV